MSRNLMQQAASLSLSVLLTLAMLGSIDHLAQRDDGALLSQQRSAQPARG